MSNQSAELTTTTTISGTITVQEGNNAAEVHEINMVIDPTASIGSGFVFMQVTPSGEGFCCDGAMAGQTQGIMRAINMLLENLPEIARMNVLKQAILSDLQ